MFRSKYDINVNTFSEEGKLVQVESAMKAVSQGMPTVGIKSKTHAVLACVMHAPSEYSDHQPKLFKIDDHIGVAVTGLIADGRGLCKFLREACLNHRFLYDTEPLVADLANSVAIASQKKTVTEGGRPYGVGLMMVGVGSDGPRLFETCPSGQSWEYVAQAIGRRAQTAKTYLEQHVEEFENCNREQLIEHALNSLRDCRSNEKESLESLSVGIVGVGEDFTILEGDSLKPYIKDN